MPALGVYEHCNGFLSYKWSDSPLEGFRDGGDISFNGGEILPGENGRNVMSYRWGNNHGSVMEVNGQWYVFYHQQTGTDEFSRQAMIEPIDAAQGKDGKVYLGKITYRNGEPVASTPVEMTSQGAQVNGLDARQWISAGYACHLHGGSTRAYITPVYERREDISAPVKDISDGTAAGFRYLQFGTRTPKSVTVKLRVNREVKVSVRTDTRDGKEIASFAAEPGMEEITVPVRGAGIGKHAVYFVFRTEGDAPAAEFDRFTFD